MSEMTQAPSPRGKHVLVAYASEFGSTAAVAEAIGRVIREAGAEVDLRPVVDVGNLARYQAAVVGSPIYNGEWLPEAVHFVRHHAAALSAMPVAYFAVCATMNENTEEHRQAARSFLDPVLEQIPQVRPLDIGVFAGMIQPPKLPWPVRLRLRITTDLRAGDYRRWDEIHSWAAKIVSRLLALADRP